MFDKIKLIFAVALVIAGIVAFYMLETQIESTFYRVLGLLAIIGVSMAIALSTATGGQVVAFSQAAAREMRKSVWPTRQETWQTTLIVLVMVTIIGVIIWLIDMILRWIVESLI